MRCSFRGLTLLVAAAVLVLSTLAGGPVDAGRGPKMPGLVGPTVLSATKHPANPVIAVRDADDMRIEQYVPSVSLVGGIYHGFVKGSNRSYHYTSPDGVVFSLGNLFIQQGGTNSWDAQYTRMGFALYSASAGKFMALYDGNQTWGHVHTGLAQSKAGEGVAKDLANPVLSPATLQPFAPLGRVVESVITSNAVRDPGTGILYLYGSVWYGDGPAPEDIWVARWDQFAGPQVLGVIMRARDWENVNSRPNSIKGISAPNVYWDEGDQRWEMLVAVWYWSGIEAEVRGPAWAAAPAGPWVVQNDNLVLTAGPPGAWDELRVHTSWFLKDNDCFCRPLLVEGSYRLYYSAEGYGAGGLLVDQSGLATLTALP